ncbi:c-type cytochrome [Halomonas organivorans]|uniref:Mono/diheme cytochrome c family protein n=1 Tax=Halomonas organivorans TaxID=257772 RepID=A0A7W5G4U4_9GAMM|nr:cytochrome c [Halomonas organivorans]MBB3140297.1 mono/diheme cytochrome c family protein [Halomonas organivorans]
MKIWHGVTVGAIAISFGTLFFIFGGFYNVSAQDDHHPIVGWSLHQTMESSVRARSKDIEAPNLEDMDMIRQGANAYESLCAACHLKPGMNNTVLRQGLNPTPPDFTEMIDSSPEEQFWVVKNGIKMTGMPSWGMTHEDKELWELVAFIQKIPSLSNQEYSNLVSSQDVATTSSHKDDGHAHEHGDTSAMTAPPATDDGHDHEHGDMSAITRSHQEQEAESAPADDGHDHEHGDMSAMTAQDTTSHDDGHENHDH